MWNEKGWQNKRENVVYIRMLQKPVLGRFLPIVKDEEMTPAVQNMSNVHTRPGPITFSKDDNIVSNFLKGTIERDFYGYFLAWMDLSRPEWEPILVFKFERGVFDFRQVF
jgi:hypothetical protein